MDRQRIQDELPGLFGAWAGGIDADWGDLPRELHMGSRLQLHSRAFRALGVDSVSYIEEEGAPAGQELTEVVGGPRLIDLQVEAWTLEQGLAVNGSHHLERLRTFLRSPKGKAGLKALGLSVNTLGNCLRVPGNQGSRKRDRWVLDLRLNATERLETGRETYIETVGVTGTLTGGHTDPRTVGPLTLPLQE